MDIDALSPESKLRYTSVGRAFGSERTLAQANSTLLGWRVHGPIIRLYGFGDEDAQDLEQAVALLQDAGVGRLGSIIEKKTSAVELLGLVKQGKRLRSRARDLSNATAARLERDPDDAARTLIARIKATVDQSDSSGAEPQKLIDQLKLLRALFDDAGFMATASARGGDHLRDQLDALIPKLQTAADTIDQHISAPVDRARIDLIDGIIVELVRAARRAARGAASDLGRPELEQVFGLSELYDPT